MARDHVRLIGPVPSSVEEAAEMLEKVRSEIERIVINRDAPAMKLMDAWGKYQKSLAKAILASRWLWRGDNCLCPSDDCIHLHIYNYDIGGAFEMVYRLIFDCAMGRAMSAYELVMAIAAIECHVNELMEDNDELAKLAYR